MLSVKIPKNEAFLFNGYALCKLVYNILVPTIISEHGIIQAINTYKNWVQ